MFVKEVTVENQVGLHARPATFFIQKANEFKSSIWVEKEERRVNAKSLLGVLSLGIVGGTTTVSYTHLAGHLLQCCGVKNKIHAPHYAGQAARFAHIANIKLDLSGQLRIPKLIFMPHVVLLFLIAGENADLADIALQKMLQHRVPERTGSTGDKQYLVLKICRIHGEPPIHLCEFYPMSVQSVLL